VPALLDWNNEGTSPNPRTHHPPTHTAAAAAAGEAAAAAHRTQQPRRQRHGRTCHATAPLLALIAASLLLLLVYAAVLSVCLVWGQSVSSSSVACCARRLLLRRLPAPLALARQQQLSPPAFSGVGLIGANRRERERGEKGASSVLCSLPCFCYRQRTLFGCLFLALFGGGGEHPSHRHRQICVGGASCCLHTQTGTVKEN
jgi:hypothetical protein